MHLKCTLKLPKIPYYLPTLKTYVETFDDPKRGQAKDLKESEEVNSFRPNVPQVHVIGLILVRHKNEKQAIDELYSYREEAKI